MRRPLMASLASVAALALGASACADGEASQDTDARDAEVRPFSEIQDGPVSFEADPLDPSAGIFRVTTTEPAICAIVWGETEEFGRFNNSLAMDGTGIEQHDVALPDLEPGREYVYILQGTTADGTLYRSEVDTFTIPETDPGDAATSEDGEGGAASQVDLGENLAPGADIVEVSSEFGDAFAAGFAIDGDHSTEWSSRDDGDEAFITLDLGEATDLTGVAFLTRSMADGSAITEAFTVTVDGHEVLGPFPAGSPADPGIIEVAVTGQQLTFEVAESTGGNVGAVEIQVFGGTG
ncbi:MAG: discoidin domain-containing protein [Nitriliruptoraceae bacterium]